MAVRGKLRTVEGGHVMFWCPGCNGAHGLRVSTDASPGSRWGFNGDYDRPTFTPSVLVRYDGADAGQDGAPPAVCHAFVTDGQIQFLGDCTHALAGQTVPLPDFEAA
ncbi:DUF6527 family protein [Methylobacterium sp. Leaf100]|uniref:DUF6527 family protein n=1 Tax=Methylobacterium sp. Leaf100 TaxID=1736252 RepID=UPI0006FECD9E|nr:DUF6527 family protein [Methylobacterium sp. Leaf100]KQP36709.1 ammonia monooxygenase [Methylobacterium sp. Leaf100]